MESATRTTTSSRKYLNGLAKCIEQGVLHYEVFEQRPIPNEIISYCVGDVQYLPKLWSRFRSNTNRWRGLVNEETKKRVEASQKPEYQRHGPDRTLAPWSEDE